VCHFRGPSGEANLAAARREHALAG